MLPPHASSLGAKVLMVGFDAMGKINDSSCASIPPIVGMKVEIGSCGGAMVALGIGGLPTLCVPTLELTASKVFGTTPSITPFLFTSLYGCDEVVVLGANSGIGNPCQVKSCTTHSSIGSYNIANLSKNMGIASMVGLIRK